MSLYPQPPDWVSAALRKGLVIPAHPLALTRQRKFDERRQRALARYYHAAGAGGIAVAVHTTQFEIRERKHALLEPVLALTRRAIMERDVVTGRKTVCIAGVCGKTRQANLEAARSRELNYHVGLLSLAALRNETDRELVAHCRAVAQTIPLMGFYLQPAAGGRVLSQNFWRRFAEIPNVVAIKIAPFNRYQTLEVIRAIVEVGRVDDIALYTGNDDNILIDLLTEFSVCDDGAARKVRIVGGLLGHWACWTRNAVQLFEQIQTVREGTSLPSKLLTLAGQVTDANSAFFDATNQFKGCIAGIQEVLKRQGLLTNTLCLDTRARLSPGQSDEIDRVYREYPQLSDDAFVRQHLDEWLSD